MVKEGVYVLTGSFNFGLMEGISSGNMEEPFPGAKLKSPDQS